MITAIFTLPAGLGAELASGAFDSGLQPVARARAAAAANSPVHCGQRIAVRFMGLCDLDVCMLCLCGSI
jgi:hypothetical protein